MSTNPNREVRGPRHDEQVTTGLERTLQKTPTGRAFARSAEGRAAIRRERERRGLDFGGPAPKTPQPVQAPATGDARPVAYTRTDGYASDVKVREVMPYGPDSPHSYFRDLLRLKAADLAQQRAIDAGRRLAFDSEPGIPAYGDGSLEDARRRVMLGERRDVTGASGGAGLTTVAWFGQSFDSAARAEGRIRDLVTVREMPREGMTMRVPRLTTGTTGSVQAGENQSVTESDPVSAAVDGAVVTIAGMVDPSQQLVDRSGGLADEAIGSDLARELARLLDVQVINGSGSSGEMTGLLQTSGITTTTYTDASPTVAEWRAKTWTLYRDVVAAAGVEPDVLAWGQTRAAWAWSGTDSVQRQMVGLDLPAAQTVVPSIPTTLGSGTDEDRTLLWNREAVHLFLSPVSFTVDPDVGSASGTVRVMARMYAALVVRRPEAVGVLAGTGCVVPSI